MSDKNFEKTIKKVKELYEKLNYFDHKKIKIEF